MEEVIEVVAALICQEDKFLICQRPEGKPLALLWEFVGGKVEIGESLEQALVRECQEELGITLTVGDIFMDVNHTYPYGKVHLTLLEGFIQSGTLELLEHNDMRWITTNEIQNFTFCPADIVFLEKILAMQKNN
ncbi:MAG: (deoxy)nucleoside triphosphate pyrophosphohydrolase [Eubacteriales bacterium]